jgi:hypothetical protein
MGSFIVVATSTDGMSCMAVTGTDFEIIEVKKKGN